MKSFRIGLLILIAISVKMSLVGQVKELNYKLNENGSHFIKANFLNQIWIRQTQNNPGSTVDGYSENTTFDIGLRRTRIQLFGQISDRVFFYTQVGTNNLTYNGARKQGLFLLDGIGELNIIDKHLSIGAGLTAWGGPSRYSSPSIGTILSLDAPLYQQATNDVSDQFLRKYSVYAKGKLGKFDYRLVLSKPMMVSQSSQSTAIQENALFSPEPPKLQTHGYVMYQFLDQESNQTPFNKGTYLGKKDVFNIGAGFVYQKNAMWHTGDLTSDTVHSNLALFAIDVFYDHPLNKEKETAITAYASVNFNDYGKNYIRNVGVMNPANGISGTGSLNGPGNAFPMTGSGTIIYMQGGYLFPNALFGELGTLQPYAATQIGLLDQLNENMLMYEFGVNWLIIGQNAKVSFNYQNRPIFSNNDWKVLDRKSMFTLQLQVAI